MYNSMKSHCIDFPSVQRCECCSLQLHAHSKHTPTELSLKFCIYTNNNLPTISTYNLINSYSLTASMKKKISTNYVS